MFPPQKVAIVVWSSVRVVLLLRPSDWTCWTACRYAGLFSGAGARGRNSLARVSTKGFTLAQCVNTAVAGVIGSNIPGPAGSVYGGGVAAEPSCARLARIACAAARPALTPRTKRAPAGI